MSAVPIFFAPDINNAWAEAPGALSAMNGFAPMQQGCYGSMGTANLFGSGTLTGKDILAAYIFRQVDGSARLIAFRTTLIDSYNSAGTRTNEDSGGLVTATEWAATAWGNQIIAVSLANATQSSTGTTFSPLSGAPVARHVASNLNFVMMADCGAAGLTQSDQVQWCAIQNPASWTPSIATQAGKIRLLDAPGPITALIAYRDTFVAFKDNAIFVGTYVGPQQFIFDWRMVSNRVGCFGPKGVVELDGKLYFVHASGFYSYDGQSIQNVGLPVFQSFMSETNYVSGLGGGRVPSPGASRTYDVPATIEATADDIEGVVWFTQTSKVTLNDNYNITYYGFNARAQKWGRATFAVDATATANRPVQVVCNYADRQAFLSDTAGRALLVWNSNLGSTLRSVRYPIATTHSVAASFTTGLFGDVKVGTNTTRLYLQHLKGSDAWNGTEGGLLTGYAVEDANSSTGGATLSPNSEFNALDGTLNSRFKTATVTYATGRKTIIGGLDMDGAVSGRR